MSYTALYRKYRPGEFDDVKGQEHIVTTLKNQIQANRLGHAYLFCGTRGTGKTTVAKILAKAVNCQSPVEGSPCGECSTCRAIAADACIDVVEMDAASNNGVEDVRYIRSQISGPPSQAKYKVFIIDEVHMLTNNAFNALLKTLEEPPPYAMFILATTEAHKIPITILSRCQRYDFRRISADTIADRLRALLDKEDIRAEDGAIRYVAKVADGSMRDGLSLLDQCISFYLGESLTYDKVLDVLGAVDGEVFSRLLRRIIHKDVSAAISQLDALIVQGRELGQLVTDFVWYLRNLLLVKSADRMEDVLDMSTENLARIKEEADMLDDEVILRYIRVFSALSTDLRYASQKRVLIEIAIIKLCRPEMEQTRDALVDRIATLEQKVARGVPVAPSSMADLAPTEQEEEIPDAPAAMPLAIPEDIRQVVKNWPVLVSDFPGLTKSYLLQAQLSLGEGGRLLLVFEDGPYADQNPYGYLTMPNRKEEVEAVISRRMGKRIEMQFILNETGRPASQVYPDIQAQIENQIHFDIDIEEE